MMIFFFFFFWKLASLFFLLHPSIEEAKEKPLSLSLFLSFNETFLVYFRLLSLLRFAERISLLYSIVKIEMIDFDSILASFLLLLLSLLALFFSPQLFRRYSSLGKEMKRKKAIISPAYSLSSSSQR
jgi:hypothetical protein